MRYTNRHFTYLLTYLLTYPVVMHSSVGYKQLKCDHRAKFCIGSVVRMTSVVQRHRRVFDIPCQSPLPWGTLPSIDTLLDLKPQLKTQVCLADRVHTYWTVFKVANVYLLPVPRRTWCKSGWSSGTPRCMADPAEFNSGWFVLVC